MDIKGGGEVPYEPQKCVRKMRHGEQLGETQSLKRQLRV